MTSTVRNLLISMGLALFGMILVSSYITGQKKHIQHGEQQVSVLVATKTIPAGTKASDLQSQGYVQTEEVRRSDAVPQALSTLTNVNNLAVNTDVYTGSQLTSEVFATSKDLEFSRQISGTERIVSAPIDSSSGDTGDVSPGDFVDIYSRSALPGANGGGLLVQVATNVEVFQTPAALDPKDTAPWKSKDDPRLFTFRTSDKTGASILAALASSAGPQGTPLPLFLMLRPKTGSQDTRLNLETYKFPIDQLNAS